MPARLVALDEGPDIPLDRSMIVVGRHPQCDARLDSLRVSRHHCCMSHDHGEVVVRDLGSTNGIRINGQRVEFGRLRTGDELSIAHIRYRLDNGNGHEATVMDDKSAREPLHEAAVAAGLAVAPAHLGNGHAVGLIDPLPAPEPVGIPGEHRLAAAVRELLPTNLADRCRIQVIVQMPGAGLSAVHGLAARRPSEDRDVCRPD